MCHVAIFCDRRSVTYGDARHFTDLTDLTHPEPAELAADADDNEREGHGHWAQLVNDDRERYEQTLRLRCEEQGADPLLSEIATARQEMLAAEKRMRLLVAYAANSSRHAPTSSTTWHRPPACRSPACARPTTTMRSSGLPSSPEPNPGNGHCQLAGSRAAATPEDPES